MIECLGALELFLHGQGNGQLPPLLVRAALAHVQFETIHPFLDGNGRIGRLLITFILCAEGALREPMLYLSLYLRKHRARYYELLQNVRLEGDWGPWVEFFLEGVEETANQAAETAFALRAIAAEDEAKIQTLGRRAGTALRLHQLLQAAPILSVSKAAEKLGLSFPAVNKAFEHLQKLGIVRECTGKQRKRSFAYDRFVHALSDETLPTK